MQRDTISEIVEIRTRNPSGNKRIEIFVQRMNDLRFLAKEWLAEPWGGEDERCRREAMRYIPIALIASIEGWMRFAVRDMIDGGEPFATNAKGLKNTRFDHDLLIALAAQKLTAGEVIAHFITCSRIEDVFSTLGRVAGCDVPASTRQVVVGTERHPYPMAPIYDDIVAIVVETFTLRHVFAHELAPHQSVDDKTIVRRVGACQVLTTALDHVVESAIIEAGGGIRTRIANEGFEPSTSASTPPGTSPKK